MLGWEYPPHIAGGLGTACLALTRALAGAGVEVVFVVPHRHGDEDARHLTLVGADEVEPEEEGAAALATRRVPGPGSPYARPARGAGGAPYGRDLFRDVARYRRAALAVAVREAFDVVHAHDWMTFGAGREAARRQGRPLVVHVHSLEQDRSPRGADPRIVAEEQQGFDAARAVVCVSRWTAARLAQHYRVERSRVRVVHNALPAPGAAPTARGARRLAEPVVLFLGRVTAQKGPDLFLEAAARVVAVEPRVKFVVAGHGDLFAPVVERAAALGLARHVAFTGFLAGAALEQAYAEADAFVLSSVSEPFGLTALEAAARGVPVILTRQSGAAEVLPSALRTDAWDVEDLADKILAVLKRPALAGFLAREGGREARALSWERAAREVGSIYAEVTS